MSFYSLVFISQSPFFHCHLQQYFKYTPILERKHFVLVPSLLPCILSSGLLYFRGVHAALNLYRRDGDIWNSNSACFCISIALFCGGEQNSLKAGQNGQRTDISVLLLWTADIIYPTRLGGKAGRDSRLLKATFVTGWFWGLFCEAVLSIILPLVLARKGDVSLPSEVHSKEYTSKLFSPNNDPLFLLVEDVTGHVCEF